MKQQKVRKIVVNSNGFLLGVSLPHGKFDHWENVLVNIRESGNCLILESGAKPTAFDMKEIKKHVVIVDKIRI